MNVNEIVVAGSLNMDLVVRAERMPRAGETIAGREFYTIAGGKGANQAVAAARLGARVAMVGRVGRDAFGPRLIHGLQAQGVDISHVCLEPDVPTGIATILVDQAGENRIIVVAGANGLMGAADFAAAASQIRETQLLVMQLEIPLAAVKDGLDLASRFGIPVMLNAAPAQEMPAALLRKVRYLVVNESEASLLAGCQVVDLPTAEQAAVSLRRSGAAAVIVTLGKAGALLADEDGILHVPAPVVSVVDSTAAGDAFIGGLAISLVRGLDWSGALRFANYAGALAVTRLGAQTSLPTREEVEAFQQSGL